MLVPIFRNVDSVLGIREIDIKNLIVEDLEVNVKVRYWEDGLITKDGEELEPEKYTPCRKGDRWRPIIKLKTGKIRNWDKGTEARIHYKVCDEGTYKLISQEGYTVLSLGGYVPKILDPEEDGCGDYIIMNIDSEGVIQNWKIVLDEFIEEIKKNIIKQIKLKVE